MKTLAGRAAARIVRKFFGNSSVQHSSKLASLNQIDQNMVEIIREVKGFTMIDENRIKKNIEAIDYVIGQNIPGAVVECGVWRGGSMLSMIRRLQYHGISDRDVYLFDTFEGMTAPTEFDIFKNGNSAIETFRSRKKENGVVDWCNASIDEVKANIFSSGYPQKKMTFIQGDVLNTIPNNSDFDIAILRLDTDWYESTLCELKHFYSRVSIGGLVIIDDYGSWLGARKAVDEFFGAVQRKPYFFKIEPSGALIFQKTCDWKTAQ